MRVIYCASTVVLMAAGIASALTFTDQDTTPTGNGTSVIDTQFRSDQGDNNLGISALIRPYPDDNSQGTLRHELFKFDLSTIPVGATINSATLGIYFLRQDSTSAAVNGYKISRVRNGNDWIEGTKDAAAASTGEPTYNSRKQGQAAWGSPGAVNTTLDIWDDTSDASKTLQFDKAASTSEWKAFDLKQMVNAWVNGGADNNGILLWGGVKQGSGGYWQIPMSEYTADATLRPYLIVDYTPAPEPSALALLAGGLLMIRRRGRVRAGC